MSETPNIDKHTCYLAAIRLLARQDYSEYKLRKKLKEKKFEADVIDHVITEIKDLNYLQEHEYRKARIRGFLRKGLSNYFIHQKLGQEFCETTDEEIESIRSEIEVTEEDQVKELIDKKLKGREMSELDQKEKAKIYRFLASKGHNPNSIFSF